MAGIANLFRALRPDSDLVRRPPAWREFGPLDIACAAAIGVEPRQVRPDLLVVEAAPGSVVTARSPCPLRVIETFRGIAVRAFDPLGAIAEKLVREGVAQGAALSQANRRRIVEAVSARLPIVEVWHDLLHYTDREHFIPWCEHRVRRIAGPAEQQRQGGEGALERIPYQQSYGIYVKGQLVAHADIAIRGDYACSIGVFTEAEFRSQGRGTSLVSAATRDVLRAGRIPLYSTDESNLASLAVCRTLGYLKFGEALYCFMAPEEERARREQAEREAERRAKDIALRRWIID